MKLPSKRYFDLVKTQEDYNKFISSGMAWEVEPLVPSSWQQHKEMLEYMKQQEGKNLNEMIIKVISASWCGNCSVLKTSLEREGIEYTLIDADDFSNQEYIAKLGVRSLPVTIIEIDGVVKGKIQGLVSVASLRKAIDDIVKEMEDK